MRIHRVELQGFGPYRDREVVDFDAFEADGIFLITGRTGAGKTSILDAVTYALFGRLPRYDEAAADKVRSDHITATDLCVVSMEFTVAAGTYRVTRSPAYERPKKRGEGTTEVKASFELAVWRGVEWEVLETKQGNADRHVSDVVPLTAEQFQQVILLAQGEFQQFLVADSQTRRDLLSKLFDTSRFTAYCDDLRGRALELRREAERSGAEFETLLVSLCEQVGAEMPDTVDRATGDGVDEWVTSLVTEHEAALAAAQTTQVAAETRLEEARAALRQGQVVADRQRRLTEAVSRQEVLDARLAEVAVEREAVAVARKAAVAWQALRASEAAQTNERARRVDVVSAQTAFEDSCERSAPSGRGAETELTSLASLLGTLEDAQRDETTLPAMEMACTLAREAVAEHEAKVEATRTERADLEQEVVALDARVAALTQVVADTDEAPVALERARVGLVAANEHSALGVRLEEALAAQVEVAERHRRLVERRTDLLERQYAEYAGVLARDLEDGTQCPVCGSVEHPVKAELASDHVSVEQVEQAHAEVEVAAKQVVEEAAEVTKVRTKWSDAAQRCGERTVEAWRSDVAEATEEVRRRTEALSERETLTTRRPVLLGRIDELSALLDSAQREGALLASEIAVAEQKWRTAQDRVEAARAEHPTVAVRVARLGEQRTLLQKVVEARSLLAHAEEELSRTHDVLQEVLREQGFGSSQEVRAARLDDDVLLGKEALVAEYDAEVTAVRRALASPDLQDVPDDPVPLEELTATEREANRAHLDALKETTSITNRHSLTIAAVARIRTTLTTSQEARREYTTMNSLAETMRGQGQNERRIMLESFALAAELEEIVIAANGRLRHMTDGRYEFRHSDAKAARGAQSGLTLDVLDAHTGQARSPKSLSGGEKFQASLALALGLAEVVTARAGGLRLDTLFIDEGFGTLDPETLESTMATLDSLREGGRTVGLISHVATLKESVPAQLHVDVTPGGWSTISQ